MKDIHQIKWKDYVLNPEMLTPAAREYFSNVERGVPQKVTFYVNKMGNYTFVLHTNWSKTGKVL